MGHGVVGAINWVNGGQVRVTIEASVKMLEEIVWN